MDPRPVQIAPGAQGREQLRQVLQLDFLASAQRARRQLSVHLLAIGGLPLLVALWWPGLVGRWTTICTELWAALALVALGLWMLERRAVRRLERALGAPGDRGT